MMGETTCFLEFPSHDELFEVLSRGDVSASFLDSYSLNRITQPKCESR